MCLLINCCAFLFTHIFMNFNKCFPKTFVRSGTRSLLFDKLESVLWAHPPAPDEVAYHDCWCPGDSGIAMHKHWTTTERESVLNERTRFRQFLFEWALWEVQQIQKVMGYVIDRNLKARDANAENVGHLVLLEEFFVDSHVLRSNKQIWKHTSNLKREIIFHYHR